MNRRTDPIFEAYLYETRQLVEKAELTLIITKWNTWIECINEIFRSIPSRALSRDGVYSMADTAHSVEDLFYFIRNPVLSSISAVYPILS